MSPRHAACRLSCRAPFHLEATVRVLQRRPTNLIDVWDGQCYRRVLVAPSGRVLIEVTQHGTVDTPQLHCSIFPCDLPGPDRQEILRTVDGMLGLSLDATAFRSRLEAEPRLRDLATPLRGMRPPRYPDLFETIANAIPFQQLSIEAAMAVVAKLVGRFGEVLEIGGRAHPVFPSAHAVAQSRLSSLERCGLSGRKAQALREIARSIDSGAILPHEIRNLPTPEALERLTKLRGIGPWSAALILLRGFGRLDAFPYNDSGAEGSLLQLLHLRSKARLRRMIDRFGDYRGYLYFCALASRLLHAGFIHAAPPPEMEPLSR